MKRPPSLLPKTRRLFFPILFTLLWGLPGLLRADLSDLPDKAPTDRSEYRRLVLDNGLRVILLSDPDLNKSSASLVVKAGSMADPKERQGLAHFLEHMLFLGTEKYPDEAEYSRYLRNNGGYNNAYTGLEVTNYHFEIAHHAFEGALDRLAQFFIAPLFNEDFTQREMNAVDSEFEKNLESDVWRIQQIRRFLSDPEHPYSSFSSGNSKTLEGVKREEFISFFERYYSANQMALALCGTAGLDQMEAWVREYFSPIKNHEVERISYPNRFLAPIDGARLVTIEPVQEMQNLWFIFSIPSMRDRFGGKAGELISYLLSYEGPGSLLSKLKEEGLATSFGASPNYTTDDFGILYMGADLTPKGVQQHERILEMIFDTVEMLRNSPYPEHIFQEQAIMARLEELYSDKGEGADRAVALANAVLNYPLEVAERVPYIWDEPDPDGYYSILDALRPNNMIAKLISKDVETDQTEPYFGAKFSYSEEKGSLYQRLTNPQPLEGVSIPEPNPFIPTRVALLPEEPVLLMDEPNVKLYYLQDTEFKRPRVAMIYRIHHPDTMTDPRTVVLREAYVQAVREMVNETTYQASVAGLNASITDGIEGITLSIDGYDQSATVLMDYLLPRLRDIDIDAERFAAIQDLQLRNLRSFDRSDAWQQAREIQRKATYNVYYNPEERAAVWESLTLEDVREFARSVTRAGRVEGLVHGNLSPEAAIAATRQLVDTLGTRMEPGMTLFERKAMPVRAGKAELIDEKLVVNNSTYWQEYQLGENTPNLRAAALVLNNFMSAPFYSEMRTRQQLGYIVAGFTTSREDMIVSGFLIQSADYTPVDLQERAEAFIATLPAQLAEIDDATFANLVAAAKSEVKEEDKSIAEKANRLFTLAYEREADWDRREETLDALDALKKEDLVAMLEAMVAPDTRRVRTVRAFAEQHEIPGEVARSRLP